MRRTIVLAVAFVFLLGFFGITIYAAIDRGFTILTVISLLVVGIMAIGIFGALGSTYDDD
jgi:hypothetical protein